MVLAPVLTYNAYTGGPYEWIWCLLLHTMLVTKLGLGFIDLVNDLFAETETYRSCDPL